MNALGAVSSLLIPEAKDTVTQDTGGTSVGNPNAGANENSINIEYKPITKGDRAGAAIATILLCIGTASMFGWMCMGPGRGL